MRSNTDRQVVLLENFLSGRPVIAFDTRDQTWRDATESEAPSGLSASELKDVVGSYILQDGVLYALYLAPERQSFILHASDGTCIELDPFGRADIEPSKDLAGQPEVHYSLLKVYDRNDQLKYRLRYSHKRFRELFEADRAGGFSPQSKAGDLELADWDFFHNVVLSFQDARKLQDRKRSDAATTGVMRSTAGQPCPRTGYWFTPARENSRAYFEDGQTMPDVGGSWGTTIWQWDEQQ